MKSSKNPPRLPYSLEFKKSTDFKDFLDFAAKAALAPSLKQVPGTCFMHCRPSILQ